MVSVLHLRMRRMAEAQMRSSIGWYSQGTADETKLWAGSETAKERCEFLQIALKQRQKAKIENESSLMEPRGFLLYRLCQHCCADN
jgi:hypothetical protein